MKLTEKELNEFPIGTMLIYNKGYFIKTDCKEKQKNWYQIGNDGDNGWCEPSYTIKKEFYKVKIPTYTEYIPPKPILDEKEKEYLSKVIRPFRNKVKYIKKRKFRDGEFIDIETSNDDEATLPYFKAGTMYKGMELDRKYLLEELRIVR